MKKKTKVFVLLLAVFMLFSLFTVSVQGASVLQNQTNKLILVVGQKTTIKTPVKMTFKSRNSGIAAVTAKGKVTAKSKGKTTITAKYENVTWSYQVKVENPRLSSTRLSVYRGSSKQLTIKGTSSKAIWSSSAPSRVRVNQNGKITAKKVGKATITAAVNGVKYKCVVTVAAKSKKSSSPSSSVPSSDYVWIPATGSKYHRSASCSGMRNPQQVSLNQAIGMGYDACKKCY